MDSISRRERAALCDLAAELGPEAPTLCEGWDVNHLVAHLWSRENDPLASPGIVLQPLSGLTDQRLRHAVAKHDFPELVAKVASGPGKLSPFAIPGVDEQANTLEYLVHHEDIRRANGMAPRELDDETELDLWRRLRAMGGMMLRQSPVGVVACWKDRRQVLRAGEGCVQVQGRPSEIVLFLFGRGENAQVELVGDPQDVEALKGASLGV